MIWVIQHHQLLEREKRAIEDLIDEETWFHANDWSINQKTQLCFNFSIQLDNENIELQLIYPDTYPYIPPQIKPKSPQRLSSHQYSASGELCLEIRTDNWLDTYTAADLIKNAYKLLKMEGLKYSKPTLSIPDAHCVSIGQKTRQLTFRFHVPQKTIKQINILPLNSITKASFSIKSCQNKFAYELTSIGEKDAPIYSTGDQDLLTIKYDGWVIKNPRLKNSKGPHDDISFESLSEYFEENGCACLLKELHCIKGTVILLFETSEGWTCVSISLNTKNQTSVLFQDIIEEPEINNRLGITNTQTKKVGIIGCGSLGSKVAASLARSEVSNFILVDDDILFEDNLVRHDLDSSFTGFHKVDALKERIFKIQPEAKVTSYAIQLGGQESSAYTNTVLTALTKCDIIIDATASPTAFNLCGSIAAQNSIQFFWAEIFEGGIGGFIGGLHPQSAPTPLQARNQIHNWLTKNAPKWESTSQSKYPYETLQDNEAPLIANDANVSVIASHLTCMILDSFLPPGERQYHSQAYLIGMRSSWIFAQPFDTIPINLTQEGEWGTNPISSDLTKTFQFINKVIQNDS